MRTFTIVPSFEGNSAFFELPDIGFQGDNLSFAILFNLTELTEHWVNILPSMIITDPKNNTFLATHTRWDSAKHIFTWFISETETRYDGVLKCQLKCVSSDDPETVVCMSQICQTRVYKSLEAASDPPEAFQSWLDALERLAAEVHADLEYTLENVENIDEMISGVSDDIEAITNNINSKMSNPTNDGTLDQVLYNNGDGTTRWDDPITEEDVKDAVGEWMDENIPSGTTIALDPTLSIPNTAAEASVTGNRLAGLQKNVEDYKVNPDLLVSYKQAVPGNTVEVYDAVPEAVKQMQIAIEPVQDLNGYTKPWAPGGGKNKLDVSTVTVDDVTFTPDSDGYVSASSTSDKRTWSYSRSQYKLSLPAGSYKLVWETKTATTSAARGYRVYDDSNTVLVDGYTTVLDTDGSSATFTLSDTTNIGVMIKQYNMVARFMIISSTDSVEWEPYANVCPISGFTGCEVTRIRKNLVSGVDASGGVLGRIEGYNTSGSYKMNNIYTHLKAGKTYTISFNAKEGNETATGYISLYSLDNGVLSDRFVTTPFCDDEGLLTLSSDYKRIRATFDVDKDINRIVIGYYRAGKYCLYDPNTLMIEEGSEATSYEPFVQTYTITFPSGQTVYGGTLTINRDGTGALMVDWEKIILTGTENWSKESSGDTSFFRRTGFSRPYDASSAVEGYTNKRCSHFKQTQVISSTTDTGFTVYYYQQTGASILNIRPNNVSGISVADWKAYLAQQNTAETPVVVVYKLATPTSIQLAVPQVQMLLGYNRLYANTGDILSLEYPVERHQLADQAEKERVHKVLDAEHGSVISEFDDGADNAPMAMKIKFEPKQDLHGYDHPWVGGAGKNLLPRTGSASVTIQGVAWSIRDDGAVIATRVSTSSNNSDYAYSFCTLPAGSYVFSCFDSESTPGGSTYQANCKVDATSHWGTGTTNISSASDSSLDIVLRVYSGFTGTAVFKPMIRLTTETDATFEPYSNICPIDGLSGVDITRTGNNLFGDYITSKKTITAEGVISNYDIRSATVNGMRVKPNTTYTLSYTSSGIRNGVFYYKNNGSFLFYLAWENEPRTFTTPEDCELVKFAFDSGTVPTNVKLEEGSTATDYEPYSGQTYTITFPASVGTVYGGMLTVNKDGTGMLSVDKEKITVPASPKASYNSSTGLFNIIDNFPNLPTRYDPNLSSGNLSAYSNKYIYVERGGSNQGVQLINGSFAFSASLASFFIHDDRYDANTLEDFKTDISGTEFVLPLNETIFYSISAPVIRSLLGKNRIWSNNGEIPHLEYSKDIETVFDDHADSINAISIRETVENYEEENVFSISDGANGVPMALTVGIEPVQDLHGEISPYPAGGGKNVFDVSSAGVAPGYAGGITMTKNDDGSFTLTGEANSGACLIYTALPFTIPAGTNVSISLNNNTINSEVGVRIADGASGFGTQVLADAINKSGVSILGNTDATRINVFVKANHGAVSITLKIQCEVGSTSTTWSHYSNICPITGWTGAEVTRTGKNLIPYLEKGTINQTTGKNATDNSDVTRSRYVSVKPSTVYAFSGATGDIRFIQINDNDTVVNNEIISVDSFCQITTLNTAKYIRFQANVSVIPLTASVMIEENSIATQYEPYVKDTYSITFPSEVGAIYGGTLTVNKDGTGTLVVDKATVTFDGSSDETINNGNASGLLRMLMKLPNAASLTGNGMSDKLSWKATADEAMAANTVHWYEYPASSSVPGVFADCRFAVGTYDNTSDSTRRAYLAQNPIQFVYELSEKITYNISAPVVKSLLGTNNIWADTGKILSVDYTRDTTMAVNSKVDTAYYEWQMQQTWDNIDTKAIPMSSIAYDIIHDYEKRRSL